MKKKKINIIIKQGVKNKYSLFTSALRYLINLWSEYLLQWLFLVITWIFYIHSQPTEHIWEWARNVEI